LRLLAMFKLMLAVVVVGALAADTEAPVLSLNLEATCDDAISPPPVRVNSTYVYVSGSSHKYEDVCDVQGNDNSMDGNEAAKECKLPTPCAWDHHDGSLADDITTTTTHLRSIPAGGNVNATEYVTAFDKTLRSMWDLEYNVKDASDNEAEAINYLLIVRDRAAPRCVAIDPVTQDKGVATPFATLALLAVNDTVDGSIVPVVDGTAADYSTCTVGERSETLIWTDHAGIFGTNNTNNYCTQVRKINVTDSTPPNLTIHNSSLLVDPPANGSTIECDADGQTVSTDTTAASATAQACTCRDSGSGNASFTLSNDANCQISYVMSNLAGNADTYHNATFTITTTAKGYAMKSEETKSFTVIDTKPPKTDIHAKLHNAWQNGSTATANLSNWLKSGNLTYTGETGALINAESGANPNPNENGGGKYAGTNNSTNLFSTLSVDEGSEYSAVIIQHAAGYLNDHAQIDQFATGGGVSCEDDCDTDIEPSVEWSKTNVACDDFSADHAENTTFSVLSSSDFGTGTYVFKYTCTDEANLESYKCRTIINQDHTLPVITVKNPTKEAGGCDVTGYCVPASSGTYVDEGASCSDRVDGDINFNVVAKGDIVDTTTVGTYVIQYECKDEAGNVASEIGAARTVIVFDTICPTCGVSIDGENKHIVEASFPLSDLLQAAVNCTDDANGDGLIPTESTAADIEKTGTYIITYTVTDSNNNTNFDDRNGDSCTICDISGNDDHALDAAACNTASQIRTIIVKDTLAPIISIVVPALMAESTQVNGWALAAIASAISGIALVGFGASRKSVATSVPV